MDTNVPVRVLHVFASLDRGGAEGMVMSLYRNIDRSKLQFDFVVNEHPHDYAHEDEINALGGRVFRMPVFKGINSLQYYHAWRQLFREHPEWKVVHAHHTSPAFLYLMAAKKLDRITIAHSHIASYEKNLKSLSKIFTRYPLRYISHNLFSCSDAAAKWMFGKKSNESIILNNSVDASALRFSCINRIKKRDELKLNSKFVVGHVGRFETQKNHDFLLDIFYYIKEKKPDAVLLLVGDGVQRSKIEEKVCKLKLEENVEFLGVRSDVVELLSAMDVFVFPSIYEGLPVTLIEAQANGLPCVVSDSITQESAVSNCVHFLSLDKSAKNWADLIIGFSGNKQRVDTYNDLVISGYDIKSNVSWLEEFYLKVFN
uniref:glycosyltransferase family 1 protein n=1 Tax=uncultured Halomonas sp. TaxID=173971 RepID=UPI002606B4D4|nr:glycosyltransferase family 1 protein [uncultured Halomonas sp.]